MLIKFFVFLYAIQSRGGNKKEVDEPQESISLDPLQRMEVSSHYVGLVKINFLHILKNQHTDHSTWQLKPTNRTGLLSKKIDFFGTKIITVLLLEFESITNYEPHSYGENTCFIKNINENVTILFSKLVYLTKLESIIFFFTLFSKY